MGVQLKELLHKKEIELTDLAGRRIAIDAFNTLYQFLSIIRDRETGQPLRDSKGRITSHLSGLFYRMASLFQLGIKPIFVFDGEPPKFKAAVSEERKRIREEAKKRWDAALKKGDIEEIRIASQSATSLTQDMIEQSKQLLQLMGLPFVQAPSEGEAQCAFLCKKGDVFAAASQDIDSLLFGSPRLLRNLSITGRRKLPRKEAYVQIKPEIIELSQLLKELQITREQLIIIGMLVGTDYNPGIKGFGPKRALDLVKQEKTLESVLSKVGWNCETPAEEIYNFYLNPQVSEHYDLSSKPMQPEALLRLMVDEHEFSQERVEKVIKTLEDSRKQQSSLNSWLKK